jgi:hypothetical protein
MFKNLDLCGTELNTFAYFVKHYNAGVFTGNPDLDLPENIFIDYEGIRFVARTVDGDFAVCEYNQHFYEYRVLTRVQKLADALLYLVDFNLQYPEPGPWLVYKRVKR